MSFKPEMASAIAHYREMPADDRTRELRAMIEIRKHFDHRIAAARRAEKEQKREGRNG